MTITIPPEISAVILGAILSALGWLIIRLERLHTRLVKLETKFETLDFYPRRTTRTAAAAAGLAVAALGLALFPGCGIGLRAKGGSLIHGATVTRQPENPKDGAQQKTDTARTIELPLPAGSLVTVGSNCFRLSADSVFRDYSQDTSESKIGGSQVDTVGAVVAKLKSARWMTILGCLAFLAGLGAAFWPPARAVMGGTTPGFAVAGGGLVIAALPYLIIGNERFLIVSSIATALGIFGAIFLYRHGGHGRELAVLRKLVSPQADKPTDTKAT
jgi:hypothetical protein